MTTNNPELDSLERDVPTLNRLDAVADRLASDVLRTPTVQWPGTRSLPGGAAEIVVKLELLQRTGSFKARGALNTVWQLMQDHTGPDAFPGVTAFSAGNHAIAVAYAASRLGTRAKVVMPRTANPYRVQRCREMGAEIVLGDTISDLMDIVRRIQEEESLELVHPFEGRTIVEGTATAGLELCRDAPKLDAVIVPIGGGGLIAGIASAYHRIEPQCRIYGVEPEGAAGMLQSLQAGRPASQVVVNTIADSLGAPFHAPYTFSLVQRLVHSVVSVSDDALRSCMRVMFEELNLAVEPACAASLAALLGPLSGELAGQRVGLVACGSNMDIGTYVGHLQQNVCN